MAVQRASKKKLIIPGRSRWPAVGIGVGHSESQFCRENVCSCNGGRGEAGREGAHVRENSSVVRYPERAVRSHFVGILRKSALPSDGEMRRRRLSPRFQDGIVQFKWLMQSLSWDNFQDCQQSTRTARHGLEYRVIQRILASVNFDSYNRGHVISGSV